MRPLPLGIVIGSLALGSALARAGSETKPASPKATEIAWVKSFPDAMDEAAERNVAIFLHSHGST